MKAPLTEQEANALYDILVECCAAPESSRFAFLLHHSHARPRGEWRLTSLSSYVYRARRNEIELIGGDGCEDTAARIQMINQRLRVAAEVIRVGRGS